MQTVGHEYDERFGYHIIGDHGITCGGPACEYAPCDFRERYRGKDTPAPITGKHSHRIEGGEMIECDTDHYTESLNPPKGTASYEAYRPVPEGRPINLVTATLVSRALPVHVRLARGLYAQPLRYREGTEQL